VTIIRVSGKLKRKRKEKGERKTIKNNEAKTMKKAKRANIRAALAQDELIDELGEKLLQLGGLVTTFDRNRGSGLISRGLTAFLHTKELDHIFGLDFEFFADVDAVENHSASASAFTIHLKRRVRTKHRRVIRRRQEREGRGEEGRERRRKKEERKQRTNPGFEGRDGVASKAVLLILAEVDE
jgi:hypothetical protein